MTLEPVSATARSAALRAAAPGPQNRLPDPQLMLRMVRGLGAAGEMLARSEQGQIYRLSGIDPLPAWQAGQTLLVQVQHSGPPLQVRVLGVMAPEGSAAALADGPGGEPPAWRPDQAAILRLAAAATDTMAQAAHWRQLALAALRQAATLAPAHASLPAVPAEAAAGPDPAGPPGTADPAWLLRILPWHGRPLTLWMEQRRWAGGANRRARRRAGTRLCLSVDLPPWGPLALVLDVLDVQVGLSLSTADPRAVAALRAQVGAIAARMGRAGLRLMRCHVSHAPDFSLPSMAATAATLGGHELPLALFRAGAEALEALHRASAKAGQNLSKTNESSQQSVRP